MWHLCFPRHNDWRERFGAVPFQTGGGKWQPRYYQHNAITAVLEAVAQGRRRMLLTLATGTGKTGIAFQIAWTLFQASWNLSGEPTRRPRILFLADRNILADQAFNSFSAFPANALCRISPDEIRKQAKLPKNASVFFTIFQTFMTGADAEGNDTRAEKIVVRLADGKARHIRYLATTSYWSHGGTPITAQQFMEQLFGDLSGSVNSEEELRSIWSDPDQRTAFIERLAEMDYDGDRLDDMRRLIDAPDSDIFDVLAYVRFTLAPLARRERAQHARATGLGGYEKEMQAFLDYILRAYKMHGVAELASCNIPDFLRIRYGGTNVAKRRLGSVADIRSAFVGIQSHLFQAGDAS